MTFGLLDFIENLKLWKSFLARDAGEFQGALDHAERRVAEAIHDAVAERAVIGADAQGAAEFLAPRYQRRESFLDAFKLGGVLFVAVFLTRIFSSLRSCPD